MKVPLLALLLTGVAQGGISVIEPAEVGHETWVTVTNQDVPAPGETVTVVHRPGIAGEHEIAIGITDAMGRVRWTPSSAGLSTVHADGHILRLHVHSLLPPPSAVTMLGLITMGGLASLIYGLRRRKE